MSWRDEIKGEASFRGVPFKTTDAEAQVGRRNVLHEYPQRDIPYVEDLGRRARVWQVECYVQGEDYLAQRDALLEALQERGPGELNHPRYGVLQVSVLDPASVKESYLEGGIARFSIKFVEAGANTFPASKEDTIAAVEVAAEDADEAAELEYSQTVDVRGPSVLLDGALKGVQRDLQGVLNLVNQVADTSALSDLVRSVSAISGRVAAPIRTPVVLAQSLRSLHAQLVQGVRRPLAALQELQAVFGRNVRPAPLPGVPRPDSVAYRLYANELARTDLTRRLALTNQARMLALGISASVAPAPSVASATPAALPTLLANEAPVATAAQALALRDLVLGQIDAELETNEPAAQLATALEALRAAVARDVDVRAELLRERSTFTPVTVLPALVLAHRIYQDANRADELAERNGVRHANFVPARALEVLR